MLLVYLKWSLWFGIIGIPIGIVTTIFSGDLNNLYGIPLIMAALGFIIRKWIFEKIWS